MFLVLLCLSIFMVGTPSLAADLELEQVKSAIQRQGARWEADENPISRMPKERRARLLGINREDLHSSFAASPVEAVPPLTGLGAVASGLDWRTLNFVTPVRDQSNCGSCWAFATTATLESRIAMSTSALVDLSEQALLSCDKTGSCNGGYIDYAADFIRDYGLPIENCFPYTASDASCNEAACPSWKTDGAHGINRWAWIATHSPTVENLKAALNSYGPLVTTMDVYDDLYSYRSGIYSYTSGGLSGGHAVQLVGYDDTNQCFIVKNSWGSDWGEAGFFRIAYSQLSSRVGFGQYTMAFIGYKAISGASISACTYSVSPKVRAFGAAGGASNIAVSVQDECAWVARSIVPWIRIVGTPSNRGSGQFRYRVLPNRTGVTRVGTMKCRDQTITIRQRGF